MKESKFGQKEITKFLQDILWKLLRPHFRKLNFFGKEEKILPGLRFDIYGYSKKRRCIAVWEIEIKMIWPTGNIQKVEEILNWWWRPKFFMFHIFCPFYTWERKTKCVIEAYELKKKFRQRFTYEQFSFDISQQRFRQILNAFESNRYSAKQYYGKELKREISRIVKEYIKKLTI